MRPNATAGTCRQEPKRRKKSNVIHLEELKMRHVFISHKIKEQKIARSLADQLKPFGGGRLKIFVSEDIPAGEQWEEEVYEALQASDYLILLYTDPGAGWDWCLYETGFFMGCRGKEGKKLVCLHHPDSPPPSPLKAWQSVETSTDQVQKLISEILDFNTDLTRNTELLSEIAGKIARSFDKKPERQIFTKSIDLILSDDQIRDLCTKRVLPSEVKVRGKEQSLSLFGLRPKSGAGWIWGEVLPKISRFADESWTESLEDVMAAAASCEGICPGLPVFISPWDEKAYRPVLSALENSGGVHTFKLDFVEVRDEDDPGTDGTMRLIANLMKLSKRVRFGLIELFRSEVRDLRARGADNEEIDTVLGRLRSAILKLSAEAKMFKIFVPENVTSAFSDPKDREEVKRIIQEWVVYRDELFKDYIPQRNLDGVLEILDKMRRANREFLLMISKREHELFLDME